MLDKPRNGLTSAAHNAMDMGGYFDRLTGILDRYDEPVVFDLFAGGGRDSVFMRDYLDNQGKKSNIVAVDSDPQRLQDALSQFKGRFNPCFSAQQIWQTINRGRLAYVPDSIPELDSLKNARLKADFILCNAGIMFIKPGRLKETFKSMADLLAPGGEIMLRYSTYRPIEYPNGHHMHKLDTVLKLFNNATGLKPDYLGDIRDPDWDKDPKRQFHWHDLRILKK